MFRKESHQNQVQDVAGVVQTTPEHLRRIATDYIVALEREHDVQLEFKEKSLLTLENLLGRKGFGMTNLALEDQVFRVGCYFGELLRENLGGIWKRERQLWHLEIGNMKVDPFQKARKRLVQGATESLIYFFRVV